MASPPAPALTPAKLVLDLLRSSRSRQMSVRELLADGALFGFSANTLRVTLSRLAGRGLIESVRRGCYALSGRTDALNDFVEGWRSGEARVRAWVPGRWLLAHVERTEPAAPWALDALGFRAVRRGLFARPDNLASPLPALRARARALGMADNVLLLRGAPADAACTSGWFERWQPQRLNAAYADALARLAASAAALPAMPADAARLACFHLGGEVIHLLAKDPLLPAGVVDVGLRERLCRAMLDYDVQGKAIWAANRNDAMRRMPRPQLTREVRA